MAEPTSESRRITLPLLAGAPASAAPTWQGWTPLDPLQHEPADGPAADAPEPIEPQGEYSTDEPALDLAVPTSVAKYPPGELLAPAGGPEAAFAAFHFGADAIYLGLQKFSARAEAENFT